MMPDPFMQKKAYGIQNDLTVGAIVTEDSYESMRLFVYECLSGFVECCCCLLSVLRFDDYILRVPVVPFACAVFQSVMHAANALNH
jgi:hypothetical protein